MDWPNWITDNTAAILAAVGAGGGGGWLGKKFVDKQQSKDIHDLQEEVDSHTKQLVKIEADLGANTQRDEDFRRNIDQRFDRIEKQNETIIQHILKT